MTKVTAGTIIKSRKNMHDMTRDKLYVVTENSNYVYVVDDSGDKHGLTEFEYTVVGNINDFDLTPCKELRDMHGQVVKAGDYVAYADQNFQRVVEVVSVDKSSMTAYVRNVDSGLHATAGVFHERAVLLKNYNK